MEEVQTTEEQERSKTKRKKKVEEYSEGVKKRIAKLTKKCEKLKDKEKKLSLC